MSRHYPTNPSPLQLVQEYITTANHSTLYVTSRLRTLRRRTTVDSSPGAPIGARVDVDAPTCGDLLVLDDALVRAQRQLDLARHQLRRAVAIAEQGGDARDRQR
jgi:hypothetical protein